MVSAQWLFLLAASASWAQAPAALSQLRQWAGFSEPAAPQAAPPRRTSEAIEGIEVEGDAYFKAKTRAALGLLKNLPEFAAIQSHLSRIKQFSCSGVFPNEEHPIFYVGRPTFQAPLLWYASVIAHESYHVTLHRQAKAANGGREPGVEAYIGAAPERASIEFQMKVLERLNAPEYLLSYLVRIAKNPRYQGLDKNKSEIVIDTKEDVCKIRDW